MDLTTGLMIPFIGTTLGAATVFVMKNKMNNKVEKALLGFASGVMIAASVWSLLIPSIDMATQQGRIAWVPAAAGFMFGILFLLMLDKLIPHLHLNSDKPEGVAAKLKKTTMMILAVTLHNIPEGMAVRSSVCGSNGRKFRHYFCRSICLSTRNCNSKFSRRSHYLYAPKSGRNVQT